jgi:hypothetical protein
MYLPGPGFHTAAEGPPVVVIRHWNCKLKGMPSQKLRVYVEVLKKCRNAVGGLFATPSRKKQD